MNTTEVRKKLNARGRGRQLQDSVPGGVRCLPERDGRLADLVLPDTTYLERHDVMSMLDRPISEYDGPVDSVRVPRGGAHRELQAVPGGADRAGLAPEVPAFTREDGTRKFKDYPDFVVNFQAQPGVGFSWAGAAKRALSTCAAIPTPAVGDVRQEQLRFPVPHAGRPAVHAQLEPAYLDFAKRQGWRQRNDPVQLAIHSDTLQAFRLAAQGKSKGRQPPEHLRERIATYFDPLPFWYAPLETASHRRRPLPLAAIIQRPMAMYHSGIR